MVVDDDDDASGGRIKSSSIAASEMRRRRLYLIFIFDRDSRLLPLLMLLLFGDCRQYILIIFDFATQTNEEAVVS